MNDKYMIVLVIIGLGLIISHIISLQSCFGVKVYVESATSEMGKMKVKVFYDNGDTKSKTKNIGKLALKYDDSEFQVAKFKDKGKEFVKICVGKFCESDNTISLQEQYRNWS